MPFPLANIRSATSRISAVVGVCSGKQAKKEWESRQSVLSKASMPSFFLLVNPLWPLVIDIDRSPSMVEIPSQRYLSKGRFSLSYSPNFPSLWLCRIYAKAISPLANPRTWLRSLFATQAKERKVGPKSQYLHLVISTRFLRPFTSKRAFLLKPKRSSPI